MKVVCLLLLSFAALSLGASSDTFLFRQLDSTSASTGFEVFEKNDYTGSDADILAAMETYSGALSIEMYPNVATDQALTVAVTLTGAQGGDPATDRLTLASSASMTFASGTTDFQFVNLTAPHISGWDGDTVYTVNATVSAAGASDFVGEYLFTVNVREFDLESENTEKKSNLVKAIAITLAITLPVAGLCCCLLTCIPIVWIIVKCIKSKKDQDTRKANAQRGEPLME